MRSRAVLAGAVGAILATAAVEAQPAANRDWEYHGGPASDRFSPLTQITPANVGGLKEVWRFPMGAGGLETQPVMIGRTVYLVTVGR
jgi:quinoprotein glucose dehydrogenase